MGDEIIDQGEDYIITRDGGNIQILAYNYTYFDDLFISGDTSHINSRERYKVYKNKGIKELKFNIENIVGKYKIIGYKLNMGMPENMSAEEIKYLRGKGLPKMDVAYIELEGNYKATLQIPVHGLEMVVLKRKI